MTADFVIVGGGIGGAVLAGLLGRGGKTVIVLERNRAPGGLVRPEILWQRSMEVLLSLRPREQWLEAAALPLRGVEFHDGQGVATLLRESVLRDPAVQPWSTDPGRTRELLLGLDTFEVRRGVEVVAVLKEGGRVVGVRTRDVTTREEAEVLGHYTVGDDGAQSLVRAACGIALDVREFPVSFACFGGRRPAGVPSDHMRVWWNPGALSEGLIGLMVAPLPDGRCAAVVPMVTRTLAANPAVEDCWQRFCRIDANLSTLLDGRRFPQDMVRIHRPWGHATRYGADGVVLMGDAIHPVSPAGGQGANMSIADARALAELVLGGAEDLLARYERRRRPANAASIRPTRIAEWAWSAPRWLSPIALAPFLARRVAGCPALQQRFVHSTAELFLGEAA